jgi:hypothetical protein
MAHKKLLAPIHPGEILFEEFMKPMTSVSIDSRGKSPFHPAASALL